MLGALALSEEQSNLTVVPAAATSTIPPIPLIGRINGQFWITKLFINSDTNSWLSDLDCKYLLYWNSLFRFLYFWGKFYFFNLRHRFTERKETEIFHWQVHSPSGLYGQKFGDPKPEAWNLFWVFYMDAGAQGAGSSSAAFPATLAGS